MKYSSSLRRRIHDRTFTFQDNQFARHTHKRRAVTILSSAQQQKKEHERSIAHRRHAIHSVLNAHEQASRV